MIILHGNLRRGFFTRYTCEDETLRRNRKSVWRNRIFINFRSPVPLMSRTKVVIPKLLPIEFAEKVGFGRMYMQFYAISSFYGDWLLWGTFKSHTKMCQDALVFDELVWRLKPTCKWSMIGTRSFVLPSYEAQIFFDARSWKCISLWDVANNIVMTSS